ncbi:MAG: hypothetical protein BGO78_17900 [Chloroflexi bacterium 44-23]|nr:MAG: hypothetical protein BGO78_17900 [Chloroflexi bacterium 44-23]
MFSFPKLGIKRDVLNFFLVGVGGQGTILASNVLAELGLKLGYDVKKAEIHGMSQRGGSVISHVRWGEQVFSPIIAKGEADFLIAFEKLEGLRFLDQIRPDGVFLVNDYQIVPVTVSSGNAIYPSDQDIRESTHEITSNNYWVDCRSIAEELGNVKVANVVLLGALCGLMEAELETWFPIIASKVPQKSVEINRLAFQRGVDAI